jgi:hypothetical protein
MSALPRDEDGGRQHPQAEPLPPGWRESRGLTFADAEALLDRLEAAGVAEREALLGPDGVTVRWRPTWPRLLAD